MNRLVRATQHKTASAGRMVASGPVSGKYRSGLTAEETAQENHAGDGWDSE